MTDKQAKYAGIEAAWRISLKSKRFPVPHGTYTMEDEFVQIMANFNQVYEDNAARVFLEIMHREQLRHERRMECLKVAALIVAAFALALVLLASF